MFDPVKYWEEKQARKILKEKSGEGYKDRAINALKRFFSLTSQISGLKDKSPKGHTRPQSERRIRRQKHQTMLRSVRG